MKWKLYKMTFTAPLHAGSGSLTDSDFIICADTLFSAMCIQTLKIHGPDGIEKLVDNAKSGRLVLSDCLPFIEDKLYLPKPITRLKITDTQDENGDKKDFKKLSYIPMTKLPEYMRGELSAEEELKNFRKLGHANLKTGVSLRQKESGEDSEPFNVGFFSFSKNSGLYVIIGSEDEYAGELMQLVSFSGIGGKRSAGYGGFSLSEISAKELEPYLSKPSGKNMTLSISMPKKNELQNIMSGAYYSVTRRAGFVSSQNYSDSFMKRREIYAFRAGSVFENTFSGDVYDLSSGGKHAVWRYMKPLFWGLEP